MRTTVLFAAMAMTTIGAVPAAAQNTRWQADREYRQEVREAQRDYRRDMRRADSRRDVREATGWSDTQLKVHLRRLTELEYLTVARGRDNSEHASRFVYALAYDGEGADGAPFVMGLIDAATLEGENYAYDQNRSAQNEDRSGVKQNRSGPGRPPVGPVGAGRTPRSPGG